MGYEIGNEQYEYDDEEEIYFETTTQEITYLRTEYALQLSNKSQNLIQSQKIEIKKRRRLKIISYYDNYVFSDFHFDVHSSHEISESLIFRQFELSLNRGVDEDYAAILILLRDEEYRRLRKEEEMEQESAPTFPLRHQQSAWDDDDEHTFNRFDAPIHPLHEPGQSAHCGPDGLEGLRTDVLLKRFVHAPVPPPPPKRVFHERRKSIEHLRQSNLLYTVDVEDEKKEKEWMKTLKLKKFRIRLNERKHQKLLITKHEVEGKIQEIKTQVICHFVLCFR